MNKSARHLVKKRKNQSVNNTPITGWSNLPKDLIEQIISKHLKTSIDVLRLRSVCSSWRSALSPPPPVSSVILPSQTLTKSPSGFYLRKLTVLLICMPYSRNQTQASPHWIIKIETDTPRKKRFLKPLSRYYFNPPRYNCPKVLDLLKFRVFELGQEFLLCHGYSRPDRPSLRFEKVVMLPLCGDQNQYQDRFALLTTTDDYRLALFRSGDNKWNIIQETLYPMYTDVIVYKGRFYAVDDTGRTVVIGLNSDLGLVANPIFGGDNKCLVESDGELMLVDKYYCGYKKEGGLSDGEHFVEDLEQEETTTIMSKVFRLDVETQSWVEVRNLGDKVFFLGDDVTFSASVSDFHGCKGNCIYSVCDDHSITGVFDGELAANDLAVFDLESESLVSSDNAHEYFKIFWPPPSWVISTLSEVENQAPSLQLQHE